MNKQLKMPTFHELVKAFKLEYSRARTEKLSDEDEKHIEYVIECLKFTENW